MSDLLACPDAGRLKRLAHGELSDPEAVSLGSHIVECDHCAALLDAFHKDDPLVKDLAAAVKAPLHDDSTVNRLMDRLARTPPASLDNDTEIHNTPDLQSVVPDFLAPAQLPDELGRLGNYRILKKLGAGGMGMVFLAEDMLLARKVALKTMLPSIAANPQNRERFLREARAAASIEHENIVAIHQVGEDNHVPFLAMPLLNGESLDIRLQREPRLPLPEAIRIATETAEGLAAAHAVGLIHRDIKPANIWLEVRTRRRDEDGASPDSAPIRTRILDFGLVRGPGDTQLTQSGFIVGTPAYMAPEQASGKPVDARSDLFSLGVVLYRMVTGEFPFKGEDTLAILSALALETPTEPVRINPEIPAPLNDLIMQLLARKPEERPQDAHTVIDVLRGIETGASSKLPIQRVRRQSRRRSPVLIGLAVIGLFGFLLAGGMVYYWQTNNGVVRIEINDPEIQVSFDKNGPILKGVDKHDVKINPGEYGLHVQRGDLQFDTDKFILKRGETVTVRIEWLNQTRLQVVQGDKVLGEKRGSGSETRAKEGPR